MTYPRKEANFLLPARLTASLQTAASGTKGVVIRQHPYLPYAVQIEKAEGIKHLPGYTDGVFAVQDVSSMLASLRLF